jgi:hypothetical protein
MSIYRDDPLPVTINQVRGNHAAAAATTGRIAQYVTAATKHINDALDRDIGAAVRGGLVRQADEELDTIIRFARSAKHDLRVAYGSTPEET